MRRRIFDELLDMQEETNRFFDEVYKRLALFEAALSNWSPVDRENRSRTTRIEASRQQVYSDNSRRAMISERYQQSSVYQQQPQRRTLPENSSNQYDAYEDSGYYNENDYSEYDSYYNNSRRTIESEPTNSAIQGSTSNSQNLPVQVTESRSNVLARVQLPGLRQGDISVSVSGNTLIIEGKVRKTIALPQGVNPSQIRATYRNGTLEVKLPRQNRKQIPVEFE